MTSLHVDAEVARGTFRLHVSTELGAGRVVAVVGPNGSGKTTLLRAIAGLTTVTAGSIRIGERRLDDASSGQHVPPERRPVGLVFQDYRLFPHLSVVDNVSFPLRSRGVRRAAARTVVTPLLDRLDLTSLAERRPAALSGGQAQRVALARALAAEPQVLLLDEPLAALDARTRLHVRTQLREHLRQFDGVCLLVTHDPLEALILGDELLVIEDGLVTQRGVSAAVARRPATDYVASLVGLNLYRGVATGNGQVRLDSGATLVVTEGAGAGPVVVTFRPSAVALHLEEPVRGSPRNRWRGTIGAVELLHDRVRVAVDGPLSTLVDVTPVAVAELGLAPGVPVWLTVKSTEIDVY